MERLEAPLEVKQLLDEGTFEGYGAVFGNLDQDREIIAPNAFTASLREQRQKGRLPRLLWQHDTRQPIGIFDEMREDERGLFVKGRLLTDVSQASEAHALLKGGALDGMSIGFRVIEDEMNTDTGVRTIKEADLREVSLVTFPANEDARVMAVKSAAEIKTIRDLERALRDAGFSRKEAELVCSRFAAKPDDQGEPDDALAEIAGLLEANITTFQTKETPNDGSQ